MSIQQIGLSVFALFTLVSSSAYAYPTRAEMTANFQVCEKSDESWHRRWGAYLVSFDFDEAAKICRDQESPSTFASPRIMGCQYQGQTYFAGYYCEQSWGR